ncbi:MAG TPA: hypothetical protein DD381_07875 [Lentisphaeria bacterium]|nr:MAG: hypothetical protein A2X47_04440 [Lentisphaerae bacterium GWF2_38_69]HBM16239.1 hypothetical protein [Lentisphaeria bacterium]
MKKILILLLLFLLSADLLANNSQVEPRGSNYDLYSSRSSTADEDFIRYIEKNFAVTPDDIREIIANFHSEMRKGLSGQESSLQMIPSFTDVAIGKETGKFIALDLGGTNLRVLAVDLDGAKGIEISGVNRYVIEKKYMEGTGEELFNYIAECIDNFMKSNNISYEKKVDLAFTFSFAVDQTSIDSGKLISWSKGFEASGVEGKDVVALLNEALRRKGIKNIKVAALVNDTVGTLVAKSYEEQACDLGVILGTGTNACYREKINNIKKWKGLAPKSSNMIINMEWGDFDKISVTYYDREMDAGTINPKEHKFEKMISGMYLGEIFRLVLRDLIKRDIIFKDENAVNLFDKQWSLKSEFMSLAANDKSSNLGAIEVFLSEQGLKKSDLQSRILFKYISSLIARRSARLSAAAVSAVILWMDPELERKHIVGIDGAVYERYPDYKGIMESVFNELFGDKSKNIVCDYAKDGSGIGAAIIAAVVASEEG